MNRNRYRTIFSKRLGMRVAVAESTRAQGKGSGRTPGSGARVARAAVALGCALAGEAALAESPLPTGGVVTSGAGSISQSGNTLTVNQSSQNLAANWQNFDIAAGHAVVFNQPNSSSVALNRVIGTDASSIYGSLSANGKVFLVNPNGVLFAPGAQVSVGGLVASTLSLSDEDFNAGRYRFTTGTGAGTVENQGSIQAESVALIAPKVINSGVINTPNGNTALAAGDRVTVSVLNGLFTAEVDAAVANAEIQNSGQIIANGGRVSMLAGRADAVLDSLINTDGVVQASSVRSENGKIYLDGGAGGTVYVSGTLDASGSEAGAHGGDVTVLGKNIGLMAGANIEASGETGGGTVLIGGNWQGNGPEHNADAVYMDAAASIEADAATQGTGGKVVLWSEKYTGFHGDISARGGAQGGNGGQVETSSHDNLQAMGTVNATAPGGMAGAWLLDPSDITIGTTGTTWTSTNPNVFNPSGASGQISAATIVSALNAGTAVTIQTSGGTGGNGDITVSSAIAASPGANTSLTLNADRNIVVNAGISASGTNQLAVALNAAGGNVSGTGAINTNGGLLTVNAASGTGELSGVISGTGGLRKTGAGTLTLSGNNTYSGGTTISRGTLRTAHTNGAGSGTVTLGDANTGTSDVAWRIVNNTTQANNIVVSNNGTGTVTLGGYSAGTFTVYSGSVQLDRDVIVQDDTADRSSFSGVVSGAGNMTLSGTRVTIDNASNTATGTITVNSGTRLQPGSDTALRSFSSIVNNGILQFNHFAGTNPVVQSYNGNGSTRTLTAGAINFSVGYNNTNGNYSGVISNGSSTLSITKIGTGTQILSGANTYTGTTTINGGALRISADNNLGAAPGAATAGRLTLNGGTLETTASFTLSANRGVTLGASGGTFDVDSGTTLTYGGIMAGTGALTKTDAGALVLTGASTYTGATTVSGGTLEMNNAAFGTRARSYSIGTGATLRLNDSTTHATNGFNATINPATGTTTVSGTGTLAITQGTVLGNAIGDGHNLALSLGAGGLIWIESGAALYNGGWADVDWTNNQASLRLDGTLDLWNGNEVRVDALSGSGTIDKNHPLTPVNLTVGVANGSGEFSGTIRNTVGIGSLTKTGTGTQILSGNNTYTGTTTISSGTLQVGNNGTAGALGTGAVTNNANLVFNRSDSVSLSTLASNAAGITGSGNVTALIGGGFNVDRAITSSGTNSAIVLEAGKDHAAGDTSGGNVTIDNSVSVGTSTGGTITIFSGNASTAAYEARVSGAGGGTRYKRYGAVASNTGGAVAGTRNYYYREQPGALGVGGLTASKVYDGLVDASSALDASGATLSGLIDGDALAYSALTVTGATFDNPHAGPRGLNVSFAGVTPTYTSGGAMWSVSGYTVGNYSNATAGTITPKSVTTSINAVGKTYDGLTGTSSTLIAPSGFIGLDSATGVSGLLLAFDDANAGTRNVVAGGTGSLTGFSGVSRGNGTGIGAGNEVAGLASDYVVDLPSSASAVISKAPLTVTANNDAKIVTQSDAAGYNGASFSGFVHGETASNLSGSLSIARSNAGTESSGTYAGVLVPTGYTSTNYDITYANGNYQIVPADHLLVKLQNVTNAYGTTPTYAVSSAQYLDGNGSTLYTLTQTAQNGNTFTFSDGIGGSVTFTIAPQDARFSTAGALAVGNYSLSAANTSIGGSNFSGLTSVGNQSVTAIGLTPIAGGGVSKVYDGTTGMMGLTLGLNGLLTGDLVSADGSGNFSSRNVGSHLSYAINGMVLSSVDAGNYYLTSTALSGNDGSITPRSITLGGLTTNDRVYDGTRTATLTTAGYVLNGAVQGDALALDTTGYSALFADKHVGVGKAVTVSGFVLSGADAGNYLLSQPSGLTGSVTPRPITVTASTNTKVYDGTTAAAATPTVTGGLVEGDRFITLTEQYAGTKVGTRLRLKPIVEIEDGNGGNNYLLTRVDDRTGVILPSIDLSGVGGSQTAAQLNGDTATGTRSDHETCTRGASRSGCTDGDSLVRVISSGIRLPTGLPGEVLENVESL